MKLFYKQFEDNFRGNFDEIKKRLEVYLPFLNSIKQDNHDLLALDLGCGRGEWLELLKENSFNATGCDIDSEMVEFCIKKGFRVIKKNLIDFLKSQPNDSFNLISAFHVIEHIEFEDLHLIIKESFRVLKDDGILLFETPNPENIRVSTLYFHFDPTHKKPIPPLLLQYLFEYNNFKNPFLLRINDNFIRTKISEQEKIIFSDIINHGGSPDYAILAQKNITNNKIIEFKNIINNISCPTIEELCSIMDKQIESNAGVVQQINNNVAELDNSLTYHINLFHTRLNDCENFIIKLKKLLWPIIKIYKILKWFKQKIFYFTKSYANKAFEYIEEQSVKHRWLNATLKNLLNKFPKIAHKIYYIRNLLNPYRKRYIYAKNELVIDKIKHKHSAEYTKNIDFKNLNGFANLEEIVLIGNTNMHHSLASINRNIIFRLIDKIKISVIPYHNGYFDPLDSISLLEEEYRILKDVCLDKKTNIKHKTNSSNIAIYHRYPIIENVDLRYGHPVAIFFWEESKIPKHSIDVLNSKYKGVVVSTWFIKKVLIDNGCYIPIKVVDIPLKLPQEIEYKDLNVSKKEIKLLHISSCFPRKGADILLRAFNDVCRKTSFNITLTIKTFPNPYNTIQEEIKAFVDKKYKKRIRLIFDEHLTAKDIAKLYEDHDIVVLPTRGEGLNMPAIEAAHYKKPIISTNYSGQAEFLDDSASMLISYKFAKAYTNFNLQNSVWAEPSIDHLSDLIIKMSEKILQNKVDYSLLNSQKQSIDKMMFSDKNVSNFISSLSYLYKFSKQFIPKKQDIVLINSLSDDYANTFSDIICNHLNQTELNINKKTFYDSDFQKDDLKDYSVVWAIGSINNLEKTFYDVLKTLKADGKLVFITFSSFDSSNILDSDFEHISDVLIEIDRIFVHKVEDLNFLKNIGVIDNVVLVSDMNMLSLSEDQKVLANLYMDIFKSISVDKEFLKYIEKEESK